MKYLSLFLLLFIFSCTDKNSIVMVLDSKKYLKSEIINDISPTNPIVTDSVIGRYLTNVVLAKYLYLQEALNDSDLVKKYNR